MLRNILLMLPVLLMLVSCGGGEATDTPTGPPKGKQREAPPKEAPAENIEVAKTTTLEISGNDMMKYDKEELEVYAGQEVTLTLKHSGKLDVNGMGHNWVVLKKDTDLAAFAREASTSKETDYIPTGMADAVIAHTKTIGGGEETTVIFTVSDAGEYDFICSFPGHYLMMKGKLKVKSADNVTFI